jgi:peroxiredoxin
MDNNTLLSVTRKWGKHDQVSYAEILWESKYTLLYFYPKDNTPGCTLEGQDFTRLSQDFLSLGIHVVGVSKDNSDSHAAFQSSCGIWLDLIADDGKLVDYFFRHGWEKYVWKKLFLDCFVQAFFSIAREIFSKHGKMYEQLDMQRKFCEKFLQFSNKSCKKEKNA